MEEMRYWLAAVGSVVGLASIALGIVVWAAPARTTANRFLAAAAVTTGFYFIVYNGIRLLATDPDAARALMLAGNLASLANGATLIFFFTTLDSPLVAWLRGMPARIAIGALYAFLFAHAILRPEAWLLGVEPLGTSQGWAAVQGPVRSLYQLGLTLVLLLAPIPAIHAWKCARAPLAKRRALILATTLTLSMLGWAGFVAWYLRWGLALALSPSALVLNFTWQAANSLILTAGLTYGILKTQLFDVDLKIKWGMRRGTVAAAFVGVFFVVSEGAQSVLSTRFGPVLGLVAAGGLVFALAPLQRVADSLADRAMPTVKDNAEYRTVRKREVYRASFESATEDGEVTTKERALLATLADELGLGVRDVHDIEREASKARAGVA